MAQDGSRELPTDTSTARDRLSAPPLRSSFDGGAAIPMNPLGWKRQHFVAWILVCIVGGVIGLLFAWFYRNPLYLTCMAGTALGFENCTLVFLQWLAYPDFYWRQAVIGVLIAGVAFYAVQVFRSSH